LPIDADKTRAVSVIADNLSAEMPTLTAKSAPNFYAFLAMIFRMDRLVRRRIECIDAFQSRTIVVSQPVAAFVGI